MGNHGQDISTVLRKPAIQLTVSDAEWEQIVNMFSMENKLPIMADNGQRIWLVHKD